MARYINANELLGELSKSWEKLEKREIDHINVTKLINEAPTADVVEVVRCKDCEYWQDNNNGYPHEECRWGKDETPDTDDYCSYGKKVE